MPAAPGVRVWDLPTRLFHWALVVLIAFSWWSAVNRAMEWHVLSGLTVLGLIVFRLLWGLMGGSTARFAAFVRAPLSLPRLAAEGRGPSVRLSYHLPKDKTLEYAYSEITVPAGEDVGGTFETTTGA